MLAFTLSLDDLVIASFTTGPGATTLPMRIYSRGAARREAGDQRDLHHHDRGGRDWDRRGVLLTKFTMAGATASEPLPSSEQVAHCADRGASCGGSAVSMAGALRPGGIAGQVRRGWRHRATDPRSRRSAARSPSAPCRVCRACGPRSAGVAPRPSAGSGLGVRQHDRIVPRALHHERQLERRRGASRAARRPSSRLAVAVQVEIAGRDRGRAGDAEADLRPLERTLFDGRDALGDLQIDRQLLERRAAVAEIAGARQRPALQAPATARR